MKLPPLQPDHPLRSLHISPINIQVIRVFHLCPMQLTPAHKQMNDPSPLPKPRPLHRLHQLLRSCHLPSLSPIWCGHSCPQARTTRSPSPHPVVIPKRSESPP